MMHYLHTTSSSSDEQHMTAGLFKTSIHLIEAGADTVYWLQLWLK